MVSTTPDRSWLSALGSPAVLVLLFVISLPAVTHRLNASDEIEYFAWLRSAAFDRDADFENEYQHFYDSGAVRNRGFHETFLERVNENGRRHNFAPIGTALLWSPFFAVGHVVAIAVGAPQDGYSWPYIRAVTYGSACYGLFALLLSAAIVRRLIGRGAGAVFAIWIGTPLLFYMYVAPGFAHACSAFAVALFLWTWLRARRRWTIGNCIQLGLVSALLPMVREQDVFFLAGPALDYVAWWIWRRPSDQTIESPRSVHHSHHVRAAIGAGAGVVACLLAYAPQLYAYTTLNGHPGPDATVSNKMNWSAPHALGVMLSPEHGLFTWTPLALLAVAGLVWLVARRTREVTADTRWLGVLLLLMVVLQVYVSGSVESWTVAGSFGQRRFVSLTPLLAVGLAALARPWQPARTTASATAGFVALARGVSGLVGALVVVLCIWWNLGLMVQFGLHLMDRQRLDPPANARVSFLELPRQMPAIAWRYLMNRESMYGRERRGF